jgi:hypothetical protein
MNAAIQGAGSFLALRRDLAFLLILPQVVVKTSATTLLWTLMSGGALISRILSGAAGAAEDQRREGVKGSVRGLPLGVPKT